MYCPKCGHQNPEEAKFCGRCAAPLAVVAPPSPSPPTPTGSQEVSPGMKFGILIATIFVPIIGIIMGYMYMRETNPERQSVGKMWLYTGVGLFAFYCFLAVASNL